MAGICGQRGVDSVSLELVQSFYSNWYGNAEFLKRLLMGLFTRHCVCDFQQSPPTNGHERDEIAHGNARSLLSSHDGRPMPSPNPALSPTKESLLVDLIPRRLRVAVQS